MRTLKLYVDRDGKEEEISFTLRRMVNAGYTGRNQNEVRKHIEELKREGITAPDSSPTAYEVIPKLIYFDEEIEIIGDKTSGEAEYVLLCSDREVLVGVGSDHTDRELESISIIKSKQVCPNLMSSRIWNLKDVRKDWDGMSLRSWVKNEEGDKILYQEATLSAMMTPEDLMEFVKNRMDDKTLDGVVIFSGTVAILPEKINFGNYFEVELSNPRTGRKLSCAYTVQILNYLRG